MASCLQHESETQQEKAAVPGAAVPLCGGAVVDLRAAAAVSSASQHLLTPPHTPCRLLRYQELPGRNKPGKETQCTLALSVETIVPEYKRTIVALLLRALFFPFSSMIVHLHKRASTANLSN